MNILAVVFVIAAAVALLALPRRLAPIPLLAGACYMTLGQGIDIGPFTFTVIRMLVVVGVARIVIRRERLAGGLNRLDVLTALWAIWVCAASAFHSDPETGLVFRLGLAYNACGFYLLLRVFCSSIEDLITLCQVVAIVLVPVAGEMLYEHLAFHNLFSIFGAVSETPIVREGHIRASGPFAHPILAGTVGAVSLPLVVAIWRHDKKTAIVGTVACITIVLCSRSSGPFMSAVMAICALVMWVSRSHMRLFRWCAVAVYIALDLVMKAPAYYLISRIDIAGGSTGWHRAMLIQSSLEHLSEWWIVGTDYTRHWMPTGVSWNAHHTDITNHYIQMGVWGGLPLLILFVATMATGFSFVGERVVSGAGDSKQKFFVWALGSALFAHAATCISVSYFDQSVFFLYVTFAAIGSTRHARLVDASVKPSTVTSGAWQKSTSVRVAAPVGVSPRGGTQHTPRGRPIWRG